MKDRIKKIIEFQHMTQQEFAECIKVAPATLSSIFTGRTAPSLKVVEAIKGRFPEISTDWLVFGNGDMIKGSMVESGAASGNALSSASQAVVDFGVSRNAHAETTDVNFAAAMDATAASGGVGTGVTEEKTVGEKRVVSGFQMVNNCDRPKRRIAEIRIFYDDQTWETFVPKK